MKLVQFKIDRSVDDFIEVYVNPEKVLYVKPSNQSNWTEIYSDSRIIVVANPIEEVVRLLKES